MIIEKIDNIFHDGYYSLDEVYPYGLTTFVKDLQNKEKFENEDKRDMEKYLIGKFSDSELAAELAEVKASKINEGRERQSWMIYERNIRIFDMVENIISNLKVNDMFVLSTFNKRFEDLTGIHHPGVVREKLEMLVENGKLKAEKRRITVDCKKIVRKV